MTRITIDLTTGFHLADGRVVKLQERRIAEYGCTACRCPHDEDSPMFWTHIGAQDKHGVSERADPTQLVVNNVPYGARRPKS